MKALRIITGLLLCSDFVYAQNVVQETVVGAEIYYSFLHIDPGTGTAITVKGKFNIPTINPAEFEILDFQMEVDSIAAASGWANYNGGSHSYIRHCLSLVEGGSELEDSLSSRFKEGAGSTSTLHFHQGALGVSTFGINKLYSTDGVPLELHFLIGAGGGGTSGTFSYVRWGLPKVTYTLRRIDGDADLPPNRVGPIAENEWLHVTPKDGSNRVHPSIFEDPEFNIPGLKLELPAKWTFPTPKAVSSEIWGYPGYRYTLMKGAIPGSGIPVSSMDGAGANFTLSHDDSTSGDDKAFFWVTETKIE